MRAANDPVRLASTGAPVSLLVATSKWDPFSTAANAFSLTASAHSPTQIEQPIVANTGGHNWGTWIAMYPRVFGWLGTHLTAPRSPSQHQKTQPPLTDPAPTCTSPKPCRGPL